MPARTPGEAVQTYRGRISRVLSSLTTAHVDVGGGYAPSATPHALIMAGNDAVALRGESRLTLSVSEHYNITNDPDMGWQVGGVVWGVARSASLALLLGIRV